MSGVGDAMRKAGIDAENAAVILIDYMHDEDVRPVVRRSLRAAVGRLNDTANRLQELADQELADQERGAAP